MLDINGKKIDVDDQIYYATTHGTIQKGRVLAFTEDGNIKVKGKGNKRELTIKSDSSSVLLNIKGYYLKHQKRSA